MSLSNSGPSSMIQANSSWLKALENDPREIRASAVDGQRMSDWLLAREWDRMVEEEPHRDAPDAGQAARTPDRGVTPERRDGATVAPNFGAGSTSPPDESRGHTESHRRLAATYNRRLRRQTMRPGSRARGLKTLDRPGDRPTGTAWSAGYPRLHFQASGMPKCGARRRAASGE